MNRALSPLGMAWVIGTAIAAPIFAILIVVAAS